MSASCSCNRNSNYAEQYLVKGFIENFNSSDEWWDAMSDHQFDGEIVVLELMNSKFLDSLESQFDLGVDDLREIGNVKIGDWRNLSKIVGEKEVHELKIEFDDLDESNWIVILYYNRKFCTVVTSREPYCL